MTAYRKNTALFATAPSAPRRRHPPAAAPRPGCPACASRGTAAPPGVHRTKGWGSISWLPLGLDTPRRTGSGRSGQGRRSHPPMPWRMLKYMPRLAVAYGLPHYGDEVLHDAGAGRAGRYPARVTQRTPPECSKEWLAYIVATNLFLFPTWGCVTGWTASSSLSRVSPLVRREDRGISCEISSMG